MTFAFLIVASQVAFAKQEPVKIQAPIEVAITLDDFPMMEPKTGRVTSLEIGQKIIHGLKDGGVPEVYAFENGIWETSEGTDEPETSHLQQVVKDWLAAGYPLGNHTYDHPKFDDLTLEKEEANIVKNEKFLTKSPQDWKWFRYPFMREGNTFAKRDGLRSFLVKRGYKIAQVTIYWSDDSWKEPYTRCVKKNDAAGLAKLKSAYFDSAREQLIVSDQNARKVFGRPIKQILLIHSGEFEGEVVGDLVKMYKEMGVKFITLEDAAKDPVYATNPDQIAAIRQPDFIQQWADAKSVEIVKNTKIPTSFREFCK